MRVICKVALFLSILSTVVGCGPALYYSSSYTDYLTKVNSYGNYKLAGKSYFIESGDSKVSSTGFEFREYADLLEKTLQLAGARRTASKSSADLCILMNYAITDQSYNDVVPVPVWGPTGISSITTNSRTTGAVYGSATVLGSSAYGYASGNSNTTTSTYVNPTYGITGFSNVNRHVTSYNRVINIYAYDNKSSSHDLVWKTNLVSEGSSSNFRTVAPYMFYSAWGTLGKNYNDAIVVTEDDYLFKCWKQGVLANNNIAVFPKPSSTNCTGYCDVALIERLPKETNVVLRCHRSDCYYYISPYTCIEAFGKQYQIIRADNYNLGAKFRTSGDVYIRLHFPAIPSYVSSINIVEYKTKKMTSYNKVWNGLSLH